MTKFIPHCPHCNHPDTSKFRGEWRCDNCARVFEWVAATKDTAEFLRRVDNWLMGGANLWYNLIVSETKKFTGD